MSTTHARQFLMLNHPLYSIFAHGFQQRQARLIVASLKLHNQAFIYERCHPIQDRDRDIPKSCTDSLNRD